MVETDAAISAEIRQVLREERRLVIATLKQRGLDIRDFARPAAHTLPLYVLISWGLIALIGWAVSEVEPVALAVLIGIVGFGFVQHAMINLLHEASHHALAANRRVNDFAGAFFFGLPIGLTLERYRLSHAAHHQQLATPGDPSDFLLARGLSRRQWLGRLLGLLCGRALLDPLLNVLGRDRSATGGPTEYDRRVAVVDRRRLLWGAAFHLVCLAVLAAFSLAWIWFVWFAAVVTVAPFLDGLRTSVEHRPGPRDGRGFHTRSHHRSGLVSALFAPFFQYHWEHHLFPGIPHANLGRLHRTLLAAGIAGARPVGGGFFGGLDLALQGFQRA